jgi:predicted DCC family thiol-disulfide oxidoreductase YuxK
MPEGTYPIATAPVMTTPDDKAEAYRSQIEGRPVLLYDGVCVFCNRTVQFLVRHDPQAVLRFVPLESTLGQDLLARFGAQQGPEGVILITNALTPSARVSRRSEAFSGTLRLLPRPWNIVGEALRLVPRFMREFGYSLFARSRYRLFGRHESCPIPSREQRSRILGIPS